MMKSIKKFHIDLQQIPLSSYVVFSITVLLIYTVVALVLSCFGIQNEVLTTSLFSTFGGEILCAALIKIFKLHKEIKTKNGS